MLQVLLSELFREGLRPNDLLLVSPFRAVAEELRRIGKMHGVKKAGTIHVAQGAEADAVILVLGGDPKNPGSKEWASSRPNLLNVAVSRAKRRLYVIGNRNEWAQYPYFSEAIRILRRGSTDKQQAAGR
jgi:superfamily I DNA and/or RNA helicase